MEIYSFFCRCLLTAVIWPSGHSTVALTGRGYTYRWKPSRGGGKYQSGAEPKPGASYELCPTQRLEQCFRDAYRHMAGLEGRKATCHSYDLFVLCFSFANCGVQQAGTIAQSTYKSEHKVSIAPPRDAFIAVFGHIKRQCSYGCTRETEAYCNARMSVEEKTGNHALMLELRGQQMQMELGLVDWVAGCEELSETLRHWAAFRLKLCDFNSAFCFCKNLQLHFQGRCNFQCSALSQQAAALTSNVPSTQVTIPAAIAVSYAVLYAS